MFLVRIFFLVSTSIYVYSQDDNSASDILFLKIQELEIEIAELRNQVESQNHLIEKLLKDLLIASLSDGFDFLLDF